MSTPDEVRAVIVGEGYTISEERPLDQGGTQFRTAEGPIVNVYDTGTVQCQGRDKADLEEKLGVATARRAASPVPRSSGGGAPQAPVDVFVVYGHDENAKTETEAMLRRWGLRPILLDQIPAEGYTLIEKLEK